MLIEISPEMVQEVRDAYSLQNTKTKALEFALGEAQRIEQHVGEQVCAIIMRTIFDNKPKQIGNKPSK